MAPTSNHLELAKQALHIAESADAKYEAYRQAAEHIAAHMEETGETGSCIAMQLGWKLDKQGRPRQLDKLLRWRKAGYPEGTTPNTMPDPGGSKPTDRAAMSHARQVLRDPEQRAQVLAALDEEERGEVIDTIIDVSPPPRQIKRRAREATGRTWLALTSYMHRAERGILDSLDAMKDMPEPPPEVRAGLLKGIERIEAAIEVARAHLDNPDGMMDEIENFLATVATEEAE